MLTVQITGDTSGLNKALGGATGQISAFGKSVSVGTVAKLAGTATIVGAVAVELGNLTMAAAADRDEQIKLANTIANATGSAQDYSEAMAAAEQAGMQLAFTDSDVRGAMGTIVTATQDAQEAIDLLPTAMDVAREAGVPLGDAADAVAKAVAGQDKALKALLPGLTSGATATETLAKAAQLSAGASDDFAASAEGMSQRGMQSFDELGESLGSAFVPVLDELAPALIPLVDALGQIITAVLPILIPMAQLAAEVIGAWADSVTKVAGFITEELMPALEPWIDKLRELVDDVMPVLNGLMTTFRDILDYIGSTILPPLAGLFTTVVGLLLQLKDDIMGTLNGLFTTFRDVLDKISTFAKDAATFIGDVVQAAKDAIAAVGDLIDKINVIPELGDIAGQIGGGIGGLIPDIDWDPRAVAESMAPSTRAAGAPGSPSITINIMGDPQTIERTVIRALRTHYRRAGVFPRELGGPA